jgi:hypothetical protein
VVASHYRQAGRHARETDEMRRFIDFDRLHMDVLRKWWPSPGSRLRRFIATLVVSVVSFPRR